MTTSTIGVSWVSFNNDPYERQKDGTYLEREGEKTAGPTLEFLFNPASPIAGASRSTTCSCDAPGHQSQVSAVSILVKWTSQRNWWQPFTSRETGPR
jgi:hypothetical protein